MADLGELAARVGSLESEVQAQRAEIAQLRGMVASLAGSHADAPAPAAPPRFTQLLHAEDPAAPALFAQSFRETAQQEAEQDAAEKLKPSLESRIGSQWFSRLGILALLIGVAAFLKYAIDNHWIHSTPIGRVTLGVLAGAGVVVWSERFRRRGMAAFSYALKAVGTGTLYLALWAALHLYHLLPAGVAFALMVLVMVWNAAMAWMQDAELLAVYALAGGMATPALLGSGGNHETFLFSYLFALEAGVVWLLTRKPWQRLLLGLVPATVLYFIAWYAEWFRAPDAVLTATFVVLLSIPLIVVALRGLQREGVMEGVLTPLATAAFLALALYSVLEDSGRHAWLPWGAVVLAAFYLLLARARRGIAAEAVHLSVAIVLLTIAVPLKASGRWMTVGWLAESVALLWAATRVLPADAQPSVRSVVRWLGYASLLLGVLSAVWWLDFLNLTQTPWWNSIFITALIAVASLLAAAWLDRDSHPRTLVRLPAMCIVAANLVLALAMQTEIARVCSRQQPDARSLHEAVVTARFLFSAWLMLQSTALLALGFWRRNAFLRWQGLVLLVFTMLKVFLYDMQSLSAGYRVLSFIGLGILLMAVSYAYQKDWLALHEDAIAESAP
jgi:uncharacterized membrane protein